MRSGFGRVQVGNAIKVLMAILAIFLLVPTTLFYVIGALGWFLLFAPAMILTLIEGILRNGWPQGPLFPMSPGFGFWGFTAFMAVAAAGLAATWIALALAYSGMPLKDVPRLLWAGIFAGWSLATPLSFSVLQIPARLQDRLGEYFFVQSIFGLGPLIYSTFIVIWLYWNGTQKTAKPARMK